MLLFLFSFFCLKFLIFPSFRSCRFFLILFFVFFYLYSFVLIFHFLLLLILICFSLYLLLLLVLLLSFSSFLLPFLIFISFSTFLLVHFYSHFCVLFFSLPTCGVFLWRKSTLAHLTYRQTNTAVKPELEPIDSNAVTSWNLPRRTNARPGSERDSSEDYIVQLSVLV